MRLFNGRLLGLATVAVATIAFAVLGSSSVASADTGVRGGNSGSVSDSGYTPAQLKELQRQAVEMSNSAAAKAEFPLDVRTVAKKLAVQGKLPQGIAASAVDSSNTAIVLSSETGQPVSVVSIPAASTNATSQRTGCNSGDGCFFGATPTVNFGFYGSGTTKTGQWSSRYKMDSGSHTAKACWGNSLAATCSPKFPPNTLALMDGKVTGISWTNYS